MTTTPQAALLSDELHAIIRGFGYTTTSQTHDLVTAILAKLQATQAEPVQAGELPPLPHDGWPARFRCDSCDGNGEIGGLISMGHFQPPERQTCPDCGGRGWSDEGPAFNAGHMRDYARAALAARKPFTPAQRMRLWQNTEKGKSATSLAAFERIVQTTEAAHRIGIGLEVKP